MPGDPSDPNLPLEDPIVEPPKDAVVEPLKDPIVERMYDYTKWHIALNGAVLALVAGGIAAGQIERFPPLLFISVFLLVFAGIAAGTLASHLSRLERWDGFMDTKLYPLVRDSENKGLTVHWWMEIQHGSLWAAIVWGFFVAISEILKKQQNSAVKIGVPLALGIVAVFIGGLTLWVQIDGKKGLKVWLSGWAALWKEVRRQPMLGYSYKGLWAGLKGVLLLLGVGVAVWGAITYMADEREQYQVLSRDPAKGEWVFLRKGSTRGVPMKVTATCTEPSPDKCTFAVGETILTSTSQQTKAGRAWDINETGGQFLTFTQGSASQKFKIEREEVVP